MSNGTSHRRGRGRRIVLWSLAGILLLGLTGYTLGGFLLAPRLARQALVDFVDQQLNRELRIQRIRFNPFTLAFDLEDVALVERNGDSLISFRRLEGDIGLRQLLQRNLVIERLRLLAPWAHLQIDSNGSDGFTRLVNDIATLGRSEPEPEETAAAPAMPITLRRLEVDNGQLRITDRSGRRTARAHLLPVDFVLEDVSTLPGNEGPVRLALRLDGGGSLLWEGSLSLEPLASRGSLSVRDLVPRRTWAFLEDQLDIEEPAGSIDLDARYDFALESGRPRLSVDDILFRLKGLVITRRGGAEPLIALREIILDDGRYELDGNRVTVGRLRIGDGRARVVRNHTLLDWQRIFARAEASAGTAPEPAPAEGAPVPWSVELKQVQLDNLALVFEDRDQQTPFRVTAGNLDLGLSARLGHDGERLYARAGGVKLQLVDLALHQEGNRKALLTFAGVELNGGELDLNRRLVALGEIGIEGGATRLRRGGDGAINWAGVWRPKQAVATAATAEPEEGRGPPWSVTLGPVRLKGFRIALRDEVPQSPLELALEPVTLTLTDAGSDLARPLRFGITSGVSSGGRLEVGGSLVPRTLALDVRIALDALDLVPLQSYLQPLARVALQSGRATFEGRLQRDPASLRLTGKAAVDDLKVAESETGETLLGWKSMRIPALALTLDPAALMVDEIRLEQPVGRFIIAEDQSNNWQRLVNEEGQKKAGSGTPASTSSSTPFSYRIDRVAIDGGGLDFADLSLPLRFATRMHDLNGAVTGLANAPGSRTAVDLKGRVDEYGEATISGEVDLADPMAMTDIGLSFRNLEMTRLTPYTVKFLGYRMASGRLSVDLDYRIQDKRLQGKNRVVLEKLELGERMESPDAIDAPLELAIALLQDSQGRIDLGVPVEGSLEDPQFSYGHLIWQAVGNLLTGIVTAPFRALGAALGVEGEDLDTLVFAPGETMLAPPEEEKLKTVARLLGERPRLLLEVIPRYQPKLDGEALRHRALQQRLLRKMGVEVEPGRRLDPVSLSDRRVRKALEALYVEQFGADRLAAARQALQPKPGKGGKDGKGGAGIDEDALYRRLQEELLDARKVTEEELTALARGRGQAILQELTGRDGLPPERVKLKPPAASPDGDGGEGVAVKLDLAAG